MESLLTPFLQTAQGNLLSSVTFSAFLLLIIFVVLTFTLNLFESNASFEFLVSLPDPQTLPFRLPTNANSSAQNSSFGNPDPISSDSTSSTIMNNKVLNTVPWCNLRLDLENITESPIDP